MVQGENVKAEDKWEMSDLVEFTSTILFFSEKALLESKWKKNGVWCDEVSYLKNLSPYPSFLLNCQVQQSPGIFFDRKMCFNPLCYHLSKQKKLIQINEVEKQVFAVSIKLGLSLKVDEMQLICSRFLP